MDKKIIMAIAAVVVIVAVAAAAYVVLSDDDDDNNDTPSAAKYAKKFVESYDGTFGTYTVAEGATDETATATSETGSTRSPNANISYTIADDAKDKFATAKATIEAKTAVMGAEPVAIDGNSIFNGFSGVKYDVTMGGSSFTMVYFAAYVDNVYVDAFTTMQYHSGTKAQTYEVSDLVDKVAESIKSSAITAANLVLLDPDFHAYLYVYGNANNDGTIDAKDVEFVQSIIDGKTQWDSAANPLADINGDGKIDSQDVDGINAIINATADAQVTVKNINRYTGDGGDYWVDTKYPVTSFAMTGSANMFMMCKLVGINDAIKAISYSSKIDSALYPEYQKYFSDAGSKFDANADYTYRIGDSSTRINKEMLANHITNDKVTAVFAADNKSYLNGTKNGISEKDIEGLGVDVVRFKSAATEPAEYLSDLYLMCFLTGSDVSKVDSMASWYSTAIKDLNEKLEKNVGVNTNQVNIAVSSATQYKKATDGTITTYNYISSDTSDYTAAVVSAGGNFALKDYDFKGSSSSAPYTDLGLWLADYDIDKLIVIKTGSGFSWYGGTALTDGKATLQSCAQAFTNTEMYYNGEIYIVSGDMPVILRTLYSATILYPEIFGEDWVNEYNQSYCTKFLGMSESDLSNGKWTASMEDLGLKGH